MKKNLLLFTLIILSSILFAQDINRYNPEHYKIDSVCLSAEEYKLYNLINEYRAEYDLKPIELSRSLTYVAQVHVWDLNINEPDSANHCNLHSWSAQGDWTACCYTSDHKEANCVWQKPRELTDYQDYGFHAAINKPFQLAELSKLIDSILEREYPRRIHFRWR